MSAGVPVKFDAAMLDRLTPLERKFVQHPEVMNNAEKAAVESGYSSSWARSNAATKRKQLMYYILPIARERWSKADVTLDRVHQELAAIAFADATEYYDRLDVEEVDEKGKSTGWKSVLVGKDPTLLPVNLRVAIERVDIDHTVLPDGTTLQFPCFVLHDKKAALKMLAEMLGGFDPKSREPGDAAEKRRQALLFDFMQPDEIDTIVRIYQRAEKRQRAAAVDAEAVIEGKK